MLVSSLSDGFDGVIDCLHVYIENTKNIPGCKIIEEQRKLLPHTDKHSEYDNCPSLSLKNMNETTN